jgi:hypothetical protein
MFAIKINGQSFAHHFFLLPAWNSSTMFEGSAIIL